MLYYDVQWLSSGIFESRDFPLLPQAQITCMTTDHEVDTLIHGAGVYGLIEGMRWLVCGVGFMRGYEVVCVGVYGLIEGMRLACVWCVV